MLATCNNVLVQYAVPGVWYVYCSWYQVRLIGSVQLTSTEILRCQSMRAAKLIDSDDFSHSNKKETRRTYTYVVGVPGTCTLYPCTWYWYENFESIKPGSTGRYLVGTVLLILVYLVHVYQVPGT